MSYGKIDKIKNFLYSLPLSIRLALSTFLVSMLTLLVLSAFLKYVIAAQMVKEYRIDLNNHLAEMQTLIADRYQRTSVLSKEISDKWVSAEIENKPYFTRLITADGKVLGESEDSPFSIQEIHALLPGEESETFYKDNAGRPYLIIKESVYSRGDFAGQVQVVRDLSDQQITNDKINEALISVAIFGGILTVFFTLLISKKTLKPVERMRDEIKSIGIYSLSKRISGRPWPRELSPIAQQFDTLLAELQENFGRLSQFSSDLAHELRTPVHKLMVELDVTLSSARTQEEYRTTLENLQETVHRTAKMLEDMLFIARAENKVSAVKASVLDAQAEVLKLTSFLQILLDEKALKFDIKVSGKVKADEAMFMRALSNLISNAARFSPQGGVIEIIGDVKKDSFIISVADRGPGIPPKDLKNVFDRFFKTDNARNQNKNTSFALEGSGLGLSIVKSVMAMHGGKAVAANRQGGGAVFTLTFPL